MGGTNALMPMVSLRLPVYRKKVNSAISQVDTEIQQQRIQQEAVAQHFHRQQTGLELDLQRQMTQQVLYQQQIARLNQSIDVLSSAYSNSGEHFEEILRLEQERIKYQSNLLQSKTEQYVILAKQEFISGGYHE